MPKTAAKAKKGGLVGGVPPAPSEGEESASAEVCRSNGMTDVVLNYDLNHFRTVNTMKLFRAFIMPEIRRANVQAPTEVQDSLLKAKWTDFNAERKRRLSGRVLPFEGSCGCGGGGSRARAFDADADRIISARIRCDPRMFARLLDECIRRRGMLAAGGEGEDEVIAGYDCPSKETVTVFLRRVGLRSCPEAPAVLEYARQVSERACELAMREEREEIVLRLRTALGVVFENSHHGNRKGENYCEDLYELLFSDRPGIVRKMLDHWIVECGLFWSDCDPVQAKRHLELMGLARDDGTLLALQSRVVRVARKTYSSIGLRLSAILDRVRQRAEVVDARWSCGGYPKGSRQNKNKDKDKEEENSGSAEPQSLVHWPAVAAVAQVKIEEEPERRPASAEAGPGREEPTEVFPVAEKGKGSGMERILQKVKMEPVDTLAKSSAGTAGKGSCEEGWKTIKQERPSSTGRDGEPTGGGAGDQVQVVHVVATRSRSAAPSGSATDFGERNIPAEADETPVGVKEVKRRRLSFSEPKIKRERLQALDREALVKTEGSGDQSGSSALPDVLLVLEKEEEKIAKELEKLKERKRKKETKRKEVETNEKMLKQKVRRIKRNRKKTLEKGAAVLKRLRAKEKRLEKERREEEEELELNLAELRRVREDRRMLEDGRKEVESQEENLEKSLAELRKKRSECLQDQVLKDSVSGRM